MPGAGALGEDVCPGCHGRFLDEGAASRVLFEERGLSRDDLAEAAHGAPRAADSPHCPHCRSRLSAVDVDAVPLLFCTGCGGAWLDAGALARVSEGRWPEVAAPVVAATAVAVVSDERCEPVRVTAAFARAGYRGPVDAAASPGSAHGLLVARTSGPEGQALLAALAAEGIEARLVDAAALELPRPQHARAVVITDQELRVGNAPPVRFADLELAALGQKRVTDARQETTAGPTTIGTLLGRRARSVTVHVYEKRDETLLDLFHAGGRLRLAPATLALERRPGVTLETLFRALARDLLTRLPSTCHLAVDAPALAADPNARLHPHLAAHWERLVAWELWRLRQAM